MNVAKIVGWVLTGLLALVFIGGGALKFTEPNEQMREGMKTSGLDPELLPKIAVLEICCAVLFIAPHTGFLGAILLTGYMGGAIFSHVRIGEAVYPQVAIGVLVWVALGLRQPEIFQLAMGRSLTPEPGDQPKPAM